MLPLATAGGSLLSSPARSLLLLLFEALSVLPAALPGVPWLLLLGVFFFFFLLLLLALAGLLLLLMTELLGGPGGVATSVFLSHGCSPPLLKALLVSAVSCMWVEGTTL